MKKSIWLSIATLCMCLGVMAFGVYSAISGSLNISGNLGFNLNNCMVSVSGTIYNLAELDSESTYATRTNRNIAKTIMGGENQTSANISVGNLSFYRGAYTNGSTTTVKTYDIVFELTFANLHTKSVKATFPMPTVGAGVTVLHNDTTNGYVDFTNSYTTTISAGATTTIKFALNLTDEANVLNTIDFAWEGITFEEWSLIKSDTIQNTNDARYGTGSTTYYYIEMGTNPYNRSEKLRWVPIAEYDTTTSTYKLFEKTSKPEEGKTYYFISEYILDVESATNYGISYNFYNSPATSYSVYYNGGDASTLDGYTTHTLKPNDYSSSNIRAYLNDNSDNPAYRYYSGNTANAGSAQNYYPNVSTALTGDKSFLTYFEISSDSVYNMITARPLDLAQNGAPFSLYSDTGTTSATTTKTAGTFTASSKTINEKTISTSATDSDKLWCLSYYEACNFLGQKDATLTAGSDNYKKSYKLPTTSLAGDGTFAGTAGTWWLRTPFSSYAYNAYYVGTNGTLTGNTAYRANGARPAFQITIPA